MNSVACTLWRAQSAYTQVYRTLLIFENFFYAPAQTRHCVDPRRFVEHILDIDTSLYVIGCV